VRASAQCVLSAQCVRALSACERSVRASAQCVLTLGTRPIVGRVNIDRPARGWPATTWWSWKTRSTSARIAKRVRQTGETGGTRSRHAGAASTLTSPPTQTRDRRNALSARGGRNHPHVAPNTNKKSQTRDRRNALSARESRHTSHVAPNTNSDTSRAVQRRGTKLTKFLAGQRG
jgi:hypothetical protein